jgi:hypothetical protein
MSTGKKVALGVLGAFVLAIVVVLSLAAGKPDTLHIERSLVMQATPAHVLPYTNDFTKFVTWIPWTELDPNQTTEFSEPPSGVGAWSTWSGNDAVGSGRMELLSVEPNAVVHKLDFIEPFANTAESTLSMKPAGEGKVEVTWALDQDAGFASKIMCVFVDMDKMLGADFEKGLTKLQKLVEADAAKGAGEAGV